RSPRCSGRRTAWWTQKQRPRARSRLPLPGSMGAEWFWVKDIVDLTWEIQRLRRFRTVLIEIERQARFEPPPPPWSPPSEQDLQLTLLLGGQTPSPPTEADIRRARRQRARRNAELQTEIGSAKIFQGVIEKYEKIDRLLISAERRRSTLLRDIKFYRHDLAEL